MRTGIKRDLPACLPDICYSYCCLFIICYNLSIPISYGDSTADMASLATPGYLVGVSVLCCLLRVVAVLYSRHLSRDNHKTTHCAYLDKLLSGTPERSLSGFLLYILITQSYYNLNLNFFVLLLLSVGYFYSY